MDARRTRAGRVLLSAALLLAIAALAAPGCAKRRSDDNGALPATETSIGPVPGPPTRMPIQSNPLAGDPRALQDGYRLYRQYNCAGCHGDHGGGGMGPSLRDSTWLYGGADGQIFSSIVHGRAHGMPSWGPRIPERQIWAIVDYVKSLRTSSEPNPPQ